jgi:toxin ParE1/3/4
MRAVWTRTAVLDLSHAREYIARENPDAARATALKVVDASERNIQFPEAGRVGRVRGTRELVLPGTQYLIVCRMKKNAIHFLRVLHGHQRWPKEK